MTSRKAAGSPTLAHVDGAWLSDDEQAVWRHLLSVQSRLQDRLDQELREGHKLTLAEYGVLVNLSESGPGGIRMSELAERLLLSRSGLTRRVDSMVRAGLVERRSCPADGRGAMALLTKAGRNRLAEAAPTHVAGVRRYLIDTLGGDLSGLSSGLERIDQALGDPGDSLRGACPGVPRGRELARETAGQVG